MAVTPPRQGVAIGFVEVGGRRIPVTVDPEYLRYFSLLGNAANGAIDHGLLQGLTDDDHPQYLNNARGDARYAPISASGHIIEDEGTPVTQRSNLNFTGAGVSVADSGGKTVVTIGGGGGSWTEAEIDFGSDPVYEASFTITDAGISGTSKVQVLPCGKEATGRTADDWHWDGATFAANPGTGSATCFAVFTPGPIVGRRKIQYSVGT